MIEASITSDSSPIPAQKRPSWLKYLGWGMVSNTLVWCLVITYFKLLPSSYTSNWAVIILGSNPNIKVSLPDIGQASSEEEISRPKEYQDSRNNYVYIAQSSAFLEKAAKILDMPVSDFGVPEISSEKDTALITFKVEGETPAQAQQKSKILYQLLTQEIDRLRKAELERIEKETQLTVEKARQKLTKIQKEFAFYKTKSNLSSESQINALSENIEKLRYQQAELIADEKRLSRRLQELSKDLDFSDGKIYEAYKLQNDTVYQQQFEEYGKLSLELADLSSQLGSQHPKVVEKTAAVEGAFVSLKTRASFLLDRPVTQETLVEFIPLTVDPKINAIREKLFQDSVNNRADQKAMAAKIAEMDRQIARLESRLNVLVQDQLKMNNLKVDLQVAEAIFTGTLAKLDLGQGAIYSIYPPIQLLIEPTLPNKPSSPQFKLAFLGGMAGSFLVTTGLLLLWWEKQPSLVEKE
jgi:uncharacterized protein involved in exopolysaccharide biosynthesis